jgi:hypothetical protein
MFWSLPGVHESNYLTRFLQIREQLTDRFSLARQNQIRPNIGEWLKDKFSQVHPWVRQLHSVIFDVAVTAVEQVNVDRPRNIFGMIARAT